MSVQIDKDCRGVESASIEAVKTVIINRLNLDAFWIKVQCYDGQELTFWVRSSSMVKIEHMVEEHVLEKVLDRAVL